MIRPDMDSPARVLDRAPYTPFADARLARLPGLQPLDPAEWFVLHDDFATQMAEREVLLTEARETVLRLLPEGADAAEELLEAIVAHVSGQGGYQVRANEVTRPDGTALPLDRGDALATAGRLVADDLCLLLPDPVAGEYRLAGAVLCFPSRWSLAEKIGQPLTAIHDPVPDYDGGLARRVNRVFEALRTGHPLVRINWLVQASTVLHMPHGHGVQPEPRDAEGRIYLRTERQTLTRLTRTGAVVFGIKTSLSPIDALTPGQAKALREGLLAFSPETVAYKGSASYRAAISRLAERACQAGEGTPSSSVD